MAARPGSRHDRDRRAAGVASAGFGGHDARASLLARSAQSRDRQERVCRGVGGRQTRRTGSRNRCCSALPPLSRTTTLRSSRSACRRYPNTPLGSAAPPPAVRALLAWLRLHGRRFYNFKELDAYKAKFRPEEWEPVYAVMNAGLDTWKALAQWLRHSPVRLRCHSS